MKAIHNSKFEMTGTEVKHGGSDLLRANKWWFRIGQSEDRGRDIGGRLPAIADPPNDFQHS